MRMYQSMLKHFDFGNRNDFELNFLVVDDNSLENEIALFARQFPFAKIIRKSPQERGHARSMNLILDYANTMDANYLLHIEDDMEFVKNVSLPTLLLMMRQNIFQQILLNQDFAETGHEARFSQGREMIVANELVVRHNHVPGNLEYGFGVATGHEYWPGFSLRPGITCISALKQAGRFEDGPYFENKFSHKFHALGHRVAFLPGFVHIHTGALTSEQCDNAYDMNGSGQFKSELPIWCINLDRSPERWAKIKQHHPNVNRWVAIDGETHIMTQTEKHLLRNNDYFWRRGIVGAWLSHVGLWKHLLNTHGNMWLVLEDDAVPTYSQEQMDHVKKQGFDLMFLHFLPRHNVNLNLPSPVFWPNADFAINLSLGSAAAYLITRKGICKLLRQLDCEGPVNAVDTWLQLMAGRSNSAGGRFNLTYAWPMLYSAGEMGTTIQQDFEQCK